MGPIFFDFFDASISNHSMFLPIYITSSKRQANEVDAVSKQDVLNQLDGLMTRLSEMGKQELNKEISDEVQELLNEANELLIVAPEPPSFQAWKWY
jgi:hypothetical protein